MINACVCTSFTFISFSSSWRAFIYEDFAPTNNTMDILFFSQVVVRAKIRWKTIKIIAHKEMEVMIKCKIHPLFFQSVPV